MKHAFKSFLPFYRFVKEERLLKWNLSPCYAPMTPLGVYHLVEDLSKEKEGDKPLDKYPKKPE